MVLNCEQCKTRQGPAVARMSPRCACHDPAVFGHQRPCTWWETSPVPWTTPVAWAWELPRYEVTR